MKGRVDKLCLPKDIELPKGFLKVALDAGAVESDLRRLSARYARMTEADRVTVGDIAHLRAEGGPLADGREVLLFTGMEMPGAEAAVSVVVGKAIGDSFDTEIFGEGVRLTVTGSVHPIPAEINDELIASIGIEGVTTFSAYRDYVSKKMLAEMRFEKAKEATYYIVGEMMKRSTFTYDGDELDAYVKDNKDALLGEYLAAGMEEPSLEELRDAILEKQKQSWLAVAFCEEWGVSVDVDSAVAQVDEMLELYRMMEMEVPSREELTEESVFNAYVSGMYSAVEASVKKDMGED